MSMPAPNSLPLSGSWRDDAVRVVEQLFPVTPVTAWDSLLDLRQGLASGRDWNVTLSGFLACREVLEADHYLPFYRLRCLLAASLRLEVVGCPNATPTPLAELLRRRPRSLSDLKRTVRRDFFEHSLDLPSPERIALRLVERS